MHRDLASFCRRQSAKMIEYAEDCADDPLLKQELLQMHAHWVNLTSRSSRPTMQSIIDSPLSQQA
jgi:hypothetical protein